MKDELDIIQQPERKRILEQALDACTLSEIATANQELREWVRLHPEDTGIREAFAGLSLMQDIAAEQEAKRSARTEPVADVSH